MSRGVKALNILDDTHLEVLADASPRYEPTSSFYGICPQKRENQNTGRGGFSCKVANRRRDAPEVSRVPAPPCVNETLGRGAPEISRGPAPPCVSETRCAISSPVPLVREFSSETLRRRRAKMAPPRPSRYLATPTCSVGNRSSDQYAAFQQLDLPIHARRPVLCGGVYGSPGSPPVCNESSDLHGSFENSDSVSSNGSQNTGPIVQDVARSEFTSTIHARRGYSGSRPAFQRSDLPIHARRPVLRGGGYGSPRSPPGSPPVCNESSDPYDSYDSSDSDSDSVSSDGSQNTGGMFIYRRDDNNSLVVQCSSLDYLDQTKMKVCQVTLISATFLQYHL